MESEELSLKMRSLLRKAGLANVPLPALAGICILGLAVICMGAWHFWPRPSEEFAISTANAAQTPSQDDKAENAAEDSEPVEILVDVEGAVQAPGLYALATDARVGDAIESAGGFSADASRERINLAQRLSDGEQIYVPRVTDENLQTGDETLAAKSSTGNSDGKININTADLDELQKLSGIGPSLSERIIDYREANGKFKSIDELKNVSGIGDTRFENLKDKICI